MSAAKISFESILTRKGEHMEVFNAAISHILNRLYSELSTDLYYHGVHHTLEVMEACKHISEYEGVSDSESNILLLATAYHDCGFLDVYKSHERVGGRIAARTLKEFGISNEIIQKVINLIDSTRIPQTATNHLEEIICDADLDYLGGENYDEIADTLYRELFENDLIDKNVDWVQFQLKFLESHHYWTEHSKKHREPGKKLVIDRLKVIAGLKKKMK